MSSSNEYDSSFAFSHRGWSSDPLTSLVELALAEVGAQTPQPGTIEDVTTFAQHLHDTGLPVCDAIDLEDLNDGAPIGSGTTMTVFKCFWKSKDKLVAVKRVNLGVAMGQSQAESHAQEYSDLLRSLFRELRVMNHPWCKAHPNFVDLLGVSWDTVAADDGIGGYRPAMIVELADLTTPRLRDLITSSQYPLSLQGQQLMFHLLTDVAEAVIMLHAMKIIHGDLKPENILLFPARDRLLAKLSDFGFCSPFTDREFRIGGTLYWNAPECMPDAPEQIRPFRNSMTRDVYSYGLLMLYSLFSALPYRSGSEDYANATIVQNWKLRSEPSKFLYEHVTVYAPALHAMQVPTRASLPELTVKTHDLLWFQIWVAMTEMLRTQPDKRHIALGHMHQVFKEPQGPDDIFMPQDQDREATNNMPRLDNVAGTPFTRPSMISSMSHGQQQRSFGKFDAFRLSDIPPQLQSLLLQDFETRYSSAVNGSLEATDLALVLSICYARGFGTPKDPVAARGYELLAAKAGSDAAHVQALGHGLLDGFDPSVTPEQKKFWLKSAICTIFFPLGQGHTRVKEKEAFRAGLESIPTDCLELSLLYSFVKSYMDDRVILNLGFDGAATDPLFSMVLNGDRAGLVAALKSDMQLLGRKKGGFTLLHVAVDYCQEEIIRELVQNFNMHPDTTSDHGVPPIELAASTGSIECVRLLISLGADIKPLANQELFTSVALTGTRDTLENSPANGNFVLLALLCRATEEVPGQSTTKELTQTLLDGRYNVDEGGRDGTTPGSPLELAISVQNYDSVIALLNLGADPNAYNHMPPLHVAVALREPVLALLLIAYGALANLTSSTHGAAALQLADEVSVAVFYDAPRNDVIGYQHLVEEEANLVDIEGNDAVAARVKSCIAILLHFGADLEACNSEGHTALVQAVQKGDYRTADFLLSMGADIESKDNDGMASILRIESEGAKKWSRENGLVVMG